MDVIMEKLGEKIGKIKEESSGIEKEIRSRTVGYIVTSFGLVAGLAWNEAIKSLIEYFFPLGQNTLLVKFLYALLITLLIVVLSVYLLRLSGLNTDKK